uniref:Uncharacterized protein n=1 Tax=Rhizophora mucronata TaxID=61149 RepID=A0A2P2R3R2_RHIMU
MPMQYISTLISN